jgi:hypothetical protein
LPYFIEKLCCSIWVRSSRIEIARGIHQEPQQRRFVLDGTGVGRRIIGRDGSFSASRCLLRNGDPVARHGSLGPQALGPAGRVPHGGIGTMHPVPERLDPRVDLPFVRQAEADHLGASPDDDADEVLDHRLELRAPRTAPEEQAARRARSGACLVEQRHQVPAHIGVLSLPLVGQIVGSPQVEDVGRLGREAQDIVIVVLENDAAPWLHGPYHRANDRRRVGDVFQNEPGVSDVEATPLVLAEGQIDGIAGTHLGDVLLALVAGAVEGLGDLLGVALDRDDLPRRAHTASHHSRQLTQAGADIENTFSWTQVHGA